MPSASLWPKDRIVSFQLPSTYDSISSFIIPSPTRTLFTWECDPSLRTAGSHVLLPNLIFYFYAVFFLKKEVFITNTLNVILIFCKTIFKPIGPLNGPAQHSTLKLCEEKRRCLGPPLMCKPLWL